MSDSLDQFLEPYTPEVRQLVLATRSLVLEIVPQAVEQIDPASHLIAYGLGKKMVDTICTLMPQKSYLNLGIYKAVDLPDPQGLVEGIGKLHRHVKIRTITDVEKPALRELLIAAVEKKKQGGQR